MSSHFVIEACITDLRSALAILRHSDKSYIEVPGHVWRQIAADINANEKLCNDSITWVGITVIYLGLDGRKVEIDRVGF